MAVLNVFLFEDGKEEGVPEAIVAFEVKHGVTLPAPYNSFVSRFDDASLYPNMLYPKLPAGLIPNIEDGVLMTSIYSFETSVDLWNGETYDEGTPPGMFFLGADGGGLEFLMSLRPADHGKIYCWYHSNNTWGTEGNDDTALFPLADSFVDLLGTLTDNVAKDGLDAIGGAEELEDAVQIDLTQL